MKIGTKQIKEALWEQLEALRTMDKKDEKTQSSIVKQSNEVLKVTSQLTDVLKVELQALDIMQKSSTMRIGETTMAHFGVLEKE